MKILAIIPARKGSKRLKHKNILKLGKISLVERTIKFAKKIKNIEDIIVTTDDKVVQRISERNKVLAPFLRPRSLSNDKSKTSDVCIHAVKWYEKKYSELDYILLLQPTSPFRKLKNFNKAISLIKKYKFESIISVSKYIPEKKLVLIKKKKISNYFFKKKKNLFKINGNFYFLKKDILLKTRKFYHNNSYLFLTESYEESIDIDLPKDFIEAKSFLKKSNEK